MPAKYPYEVAVQKFWERVSIGNVIECWNWKSCKHYKGYGELTFQGKKVKAHRTAWILTHGQIPDGLLVCHKCDNPSCCNPYHMFLGTIQDNNNDKVAKGRQSALFGEDNPAAVLNPEKVALIHELHGHGLSQLEIGEQMGVARTTIGAILRNEIWRNN